MLPTWGRGLVCVLPVTKLVASSAISVSILIVRSAVMMNRSKERLLCKPAVDVICQRDTVQTGQLPHAVVVARGR